MRLKNRDWKCPKRMTFLFLANYPKEEALESCHERKVFFLNSNHRVKFWKDTKVLPFWRQDSLKLCYNFCCGVSKKSTSQPRNLNAWCLGADGESQRCGIAGRSTPWQWALKFQSLTLLLACSAPSPFLCSPLPFLLPSSFSSFLLYVHTTKLWALSFLLLVSCLPPAFLLSPLLRTLWNGKPNGKLL